MQAAPKETSVGFPTTVSTQSATGLAILCWLLAAGVYIAARITAPLIQSFGSWLVNQFKKSPEAESAGDRLSKENSLIDTKENQKGVVLDGTPREAAGLDRGLTGSARAEVSELHESTLDVLIGLNGTQSAKELLKIRQELSDGDDLELEDPKSTPTIINQENPNEAPVDPEKMDTDTEETTNFHH